MLRSAAVLLLVGSLVAAAQAGKFNPKLSLGDTAPEWKDLPGVDGRQHSLADLADKEVVVVVFTCNSCPYAVDYEDRLIAFAEQHTGPRSKVAVVAINVNTVEEDKFPQMQARAEEKGFDFPYLYDESQKIAKAYGANYTPEFFVLNKARKIVYMGAFDDNSDMDQVKTKYVEPAVAATLSGAKIEIAETAAVGCAVRYVSERRKKKK